MAEPSTKKQRVEQLTQFEKLAALTTIVADTGEIAQIKKYVPTDATTNPSLLYKAASAPEHQGLVDDALAYGKALEGVCVVCVRAVRSSCVPISVYFFRDENGQRRDGCRDMSRRVPATHSFPFVRTRSHSKKVSSNSLSVAPFLPSSFYATWSACGSTSV